ncbi:MAG: hypothetical protein MUP25_02525 [Syntrophales bacterium]|nr:hypothetical protein [Syntrophales bacterium]
MIADPMESLGVDVDDHHFLFFLGQLFGEMIAHLTRANNDDFHRGNLVFIRLWFSPFPHLW